MDRWSTEKNISERFVRESIGYGAYPSFSLYMNARALGAILMVVVVTFGTYETIENRQRRKYVAYSLGLA